MHKGQPLKTAHLSTFRNVLIIIVLCCTATPGRAQSFDWADVKMAYLIDRMHYWSDYCFNDPTDKKVDSLRNASGRVYDFVENIITRFPAAMTAELPKSRLKGLRYVTSEDGKFRVYSWQARLEGHGAAPNFEYRDVAAFVPYDGVRKYHNISNGTEGGYCTNITSIKNRDSATVYIANYYTVHAGEKTEKLKAYMMAGGELKEVSVFQNGEKVPKHLWCEYVMPVHDPKFLVPVIHFSKTKNKLYIPVTETRGSQSFLTDRYDTYIFNGYMYAYDKYADSRISK